MQLRSKQSAMFKTQRRPAKTPSGSTVYCRALTLIELLVVIAIIGILAALLLPTLSRAYRRAQVLACPIAYVSSNGTVYLTDPTGSRELKVCSRKATAGTVTWSPNGQFVAFSSDTNTAIVNPASEQVRLVPGLANALWISDTVLQGILWYKAGNYHELWRVDMQTGDRWCWKRVRDLGLPYGQISAKYEPYRCGGFLVCEPDQTWTPMADVVIRDEEWNLVRVIWEDANNDTQDWNARVDYEGTTIAWTRGRWPGPVGIKWAVAIKALEDEPETRPRLLGLQFESVSFCDWTVHGELLVAICDKGKQYHATMSIDGRILRTFPASKGFFDDPPRAAWRRDEHW